MLSLFSTECKSNSVIEPERENGQGYESTEKSTKITTTPPYPHHTHTLQWRHFSAMAPQNTTNMTVYSKAFSY